MVKPKYIKRPHEASIYFEDGKYVFRPLVRARLEDGEVEIKKGDNWLPLDKSLANTHCLLFDDGATHQQMLKELDSTDG